jgi:hypothetical protein
MSTRPLPLSLALVFVLAPPVSTAGESDVAAAWKAYAQSSLTPAFSWAEKPAVREPTVRSVSGGSLAPTADLLRLSPRLSLAIDQPRDASAEFGGELGSSAALGSGLLRSGFAPTLRTSLPSGVQFGLGVVLAQQRFLTPGMGETTRRADHPNVVAQFGPQGEVVSGHGLRAQLSVPAGESSFWTVSLQSKLEMEPFKSYRGVYSEAGDFDVPGQAGLRFGRNVGPATLSLGVDRVFYSDIAAVTSYGLPNRFLSLLGDGGSPDFAWRDLTVYSAGIDLASSRDGSLSLRFSTRLQPSPTSTLLDAAMRPDYSNRNLSLAYRHGLGRYGEFLLNASYSGASYFATGMPLRQARFDRGSIAEIEMLWSYLF